MLQKQSRFIAILMVCVILAFAVVVPLGHAKKMPRWLVPLWIIYTALEDVLSGIDRLIAAITQDVEEMEDALSDTNDELDKWYPKRDDLEDKIGEYQDKLDVLAAEHEAALEKRRNAEARIRTLNRQIAQIEASLSMLSGSKSELRAALEAQLRQKKSEILQAKKEIKDANKIINSQWRSIKRSWYKTLIGDSFSGLKGELTELNGRIGYLETLADNLERDINKKNTEKENETTRRGTVQEKVDKARENYQNAKKKGKPGTEK